MVKDDSIELPAELMKTGREHRVPLSPQTRETLDRLRELSDGSDYVLPSPRNRHKPISIGTFKPIITRLGYTTGDVTPHGFRASLSTLANKAEDDNHRRLFESGTVEHALSHVEKDKIKRAYDRDDAFNQRIRLMQWWADLLDNKENGNG
jgi:integrase